MEYLLVNAPKPANKDKLLQALTGRDKEITPNAVEVYISRLRSKLEPYGIALRCIRGLVTVWRWRSRARSIPSTPPVSRCRWPPCPPARGRAGSPDRTGHR